MKVVSDIVIVDVAPAKYATPPCYPAVATLIDDVELMIKVLVAGQFKLTNPPFPLVATALVIIQEVKVLEIEQVAVLGAYINPPSEVAVLDEIVLLVN